MASFVPYNISLSSSSASFVYEPWRDGWYALAGDPAGGWRSNWSGNLTTWPAQAGVNNLGVGVPLRQTGLDGANVTLQFEGTAVYFCFTPTGAAFTFAVDGNPISTTGSASDPACARTGAQLMAYTDGLSYGSHSASLRVNSEGNTDFLFFGGVATVGLNGSNPVIQEIDDTDPGWTFEPASAWIYSNQSSPDSIGDYNHTRHWMCAYGPSYTASYTFCNSSAVQLLGLLNLNVGPYTIQLDGQSSVWNGSDLWRESQQVLFYQSGLDPTKEHTITLINYDPAVPHAQQPVGDDYYPCASVDALILTKSTPAPADEQWSGSGGNSNSGGSGRSSLAGRIVGGVVGGLAAICLIAALLWFLCWRRRRTGETASIEPFYIDPVPLQYTEVTPYTIQGQGYSAIPMGDGSGPGTGAPSPGGYPHGNGPRGQMVAISSSPLTSRSAPPHTKEQRDTTLPPVPPNLQPALSSSPGQQMQSAASTPGRDRVDMQGPTTQELVTMLNQRLRAEYRAENEEDLDPPNYEPVH